METTRALRGQPREVEWLSTGFVVRSSARILLGDSLGGMILPTLVGRVIETTGAASMTRLVTASLSLNLIAFAFLPRAYRRSVAAGSDGTAAAL